MSQFPANSPNNPQSSGSTQLVIIAGVVALVAVILMNVYVELRAAADAEDTETFFRLKVDRQRNDILTDRDVETVEIPRSQVKAFGTDAIRESSDRANVPAGGYERQFTISAKTGEIIRDSMFLRDNSGRLGLDLDPGNRLFALPVNTDNQPPNLSPEDYVDVYANVMRRTGTQSMLVMERVQVRLVGNRIVESGANSSSSRSVKYGNITVEVNRSEVQKLADIQTRIAGNEFVIVVRGPGDRQMTLEEEAMVNPDVMDMLGLD